MMGRQVPQLLKRSPTISWMTKFVSARCKDQSRARVPVAERDLSSMAAAAPAAAHACWSFSALSSVMFVVRDS